MDNISLLFRGQQLNIFLKLPRLQKLALYSSMAFLGMWIIQGFDSSPLQLIIPFYEVLPQILSGQLPWSAMIDQYNYYYGKEMHYSALVIYFLLWYFASKQMERNGISKSRNFVYSSAIMFLAISLFEWFWISSFSYFQAQPWVMAWSFPQAKILIQEAAFLIVGSLGILYMWNMSYILKGSGRHAEYLGRFYTFRLKEKLPWIMLALSVAAALLWIYYPFPTEQITVPIGDGSVWQSSRLFPQTLYTVELTPNDGINAGVWHYVQNDAVHAVNTLVKVIWAMTTYTMFRVKRVDL